MKYIVYISSQIDALSNEVKIGEADDFEGACQVLDEYLKSSKHITTPYWRYLLCDDSIFIDFGSWSKFGAIVPAVSIEEMNKDRAR